MAKATARASGLNRKPPMPGIRPSGASTIIVVQVATMTGTMTSIEPSRAAPQARLAHRAVAVDVLQGDDGVVHQRADGQGQTAQRHGVDGVAGDV